MGDGVEIRTGKDHQGQFGVELSIPAGSVDAQVIASLAGQAASGVKDPRTGFTVDIPGENRQAAEALEKLVLDKLPEQIRAKLLEKGRGDKFSIRQVMEFALPGGDASALEQMHDSVRDDITTDDIKAGAKPGDILKR